VPKKGVVEVRKRAVGFKNRYQVPQKWAVGFEKGRWRLRTGGGVKNR